MGKEEQVIKQILDFANSEDRVRAVIMNGSRVNPNNPKDIMQDYDVVFFVQDINNISYKMNREWIKRFGELVMLQQNDFEHGYIFLMQFKDGVRIDLSFQDIERVKEVVKEDSLTMLLLDKDNIIGQLPPPNDSTYHIKKPSKEEFDQILNESWWIQTYVAKGIWRDELPYAKFMFDEILMSCIRKLLAWHIGMEHGWSINPGKCGKWFKRLLPEGTYNELVSLYPSTDYEEIWESLFNAGKLIRRIGTNLADNLGYTYPLQDDINVSEYLHKVQVLPRGSQTF